MGLTVFCQSVRVFPSLQPQERPHAAEGILHSSHREEQGPRDQAHAPDRRLHA